MSSHEKTLKLVTNLDRQGIEALIAELRNAAQAKNLPELAALLGGLEGQPRADLEARIKNALKWLRDKPEHKALMAQLEMVELNLPNLK